MKVVVRQKPDHVSALVTLSWCQLELKEYEEAVSSARRAIAIDPNDHVGRNNLGWGLLMLGQFDEAVAEFEASLERKPDYLLARNNLGYAYIKLGRDSDALEVLRIAVEMILARPPSFGDRGSTEVIEE
ncbi:MAG: tetratricopeptide repeat protein [Acidobacteria bacterium]|nr:tetratricopeptide repeat protein [Acidobacteriota bacterium]